MGGVYAGKRGRRTARIVSKRGKTTGIKIDSVRILEKGWQGKKAMGSRRGLKQQTDEREGATESLESVGNKNHKRAESSSDGKKKRASGNGGQREIGGKDAKGRSIS